MRTGQVIEAVTPMIDRSSRPDATTKIMEKGISKSKMLKSEEACRERNISRCS